MEERTERFISVDNERQECQNCKNAYYEKGVAGMYCKHDNSFISGAVRNDCPYYIKKEC